MKISAIDIFDCLDSLTHQRYHSAAIASATESAVEISKAQLEYGVVKETPNL